MKPLRTTCQLCESDISGLNSERNNQTSYTVSALCESLASLACDKNLFVVIDDRLYGPALPIHILQGSSRIARPE